MTEALEGQMSIYDLDSWCGKTYPEPCRAETPKAKTSASSSKKRQGSATRLPLFLDLRTDDGQAQGASWGTGFPWHGKSMTPSGGAFHSVESGFVCLRTSTDTQQPMYSLTFNTGEKPREPMPTKLSEILEETPNPKYSLSARACQGILNRAAKRGKELPEILRTALENQCNDGSDSEN